jgi:WD40 repeat protein
VVGGSLQLYQKTNFRWNLTDTLITEPRKRGKQRDFISTLTQPSSERIAVGSFLGSIRVVDLTQKKIAATHQVSREKIWSITSLSESAIASGGEEGVVRLWDIRSSQKPHEWPKLKGSVSALLKFDDHLLVAGSCPEKPLQHGGASLTFYDIRQRAAIDDKKQ